MASEAVIQEVTRRLVEGFHPVAIILFGSHARGTARENSDLDLLVVCEEVKDRGQAWLAMDRSLFGLRLPRDIVVCTVEEFRRLRELPGTVARPAWLEGKVLHGNAA